ncbi:MAG: hypothetical protein H6597_01310 [Flavobacteriales bacterium]|nr:hypothetical protein [Flavobacteriales bacterium]
MRGKEYVIGLGYRFKNVKFLDHHRGNWPKSDVNLRVDLSWRRQNNTVIRKDRRSSRTRSPRGSGHPVDWRFGGLCHQPRLNVRAFYERVGEQNR